MKKYLLAILSGVIIGLTFRFRVLALLIWVGLIPFLFAFDTKRGRKEAFYLGWVMGVPLLAIGGYWAIYPLMKFSGFPLIINFIIFLFGASLLALYFGLFSFLLSFLEEKFDLHLLILIPVVWTGVEFIRVLISLEFPFFYLAYSQAFIPELIQLASYGGVSLVTFLIVLVNTLIFSSIKKKDYRYFLTGALVFAIIFIQGFLVLEGEEEIRKSINISLIQPNFPQELKMDPRKQKEITESLLDQTREELVNNESDLLIWPETAILRTYYEDRRLPFNLPTKTPLFIGGFAREGEGRDKVLNSAFLFDERRLPIERYSKLKLVPFGEYVPFPSLIPDIIQSGMNNLTHGSEKVEFEINNFSWISPICSEILNSQLVRSLYSQQDFIVNISNEAWFEESHAPMQILQAGIFRSVEYRTPLVKVANTGISGIVDSKGRVLVESALFETWSHTGKLNIPHRVETPYYKLGNYFGWVNLLIIIGLSLLGIYRERKDR
ncbi:apolipoprotein N-acyltransferase [Halonatronum saccharophilum]|uniref:apolipoprotein N-acyltransferase n=1 Tax=Halonatronum saccharophilum TaxID=150060 RepID=UPI0004BACE18|nr:apolipoprotein N-acyltransferase [Halonatronum saccharophilum]